MTRENDDKVKGAQPQRPRVPLVVKLFLVTALLILMVIGIAIGITIQRANRIAQRTVRGAISSAANLFKELEKNRLDSVALGARALTSDVNFLALVRNLTLAEASPTSEAPPATTPAAPGAPSASEPVNSRFDNYPDFFDQLQQRRLLVKSDLLMLVDDQGHVVGRTDQSSAQPVPEDMYATQPIVKQIIDSNSDEPVAGAISTGGRLYHAAVSPLGARTARVGFIVNAKAIDDEFANQIAKTTKTDVLFLPAAGGAAEGWRSSDAPKISDMRRMPEVSSIFSTGSIIPPHTVLIEGSSYVLTGEPLSSEQTTKPLGAAVFVRSLDTELAPFKEIERTLVLAGGFALLLAFVVSWLVAKRLTRPIEELSIIAQSITAGDLSVTPESNRSDEVGILASSFAKMISALRDKAELEELFQQMSERGVKPTGALKALQAAALSEGSILVTDLRGLPMTVGEGTAADVMALVTRTMRLQEDEIRRQDGAIMEIVGHRMVSVFRGDRGVIRAIRAARAISEELSAPVDGGNPLGIGVGIATGEFISGSVELKTESGLALVGNAPLLAMLFAWEAPTAYAFITMESAQAAGPDILNSVTKEEVRVRWMPMPIALASLPLGNMSTGAIRTLGSTSAGTLRLDGITEPDLGPGELVIGSLFAGRYLIEQILGRGGMGVVYRAIDKQLDEPVAIKTLPGDVMSRSPEELERFKREIRLARRITHRNVLRTYDYGEAEGNYFISMEYVRGYTLSELLEETPKMAPRLAMGVSRQISRGLQAAHEQGVIHRDIKPQNVLIDQKGEVKLMDFGIARVAEAEAMTQQGLVVGTPHYMSPEQVQGKSLEASTDVYSMGIMMYEMVCGERPFDSTSLTAVLTAHITEAAIPPIEKRPEIGAEISGIIMKCLTKDPRQRYQNSGELLTALDRLQTTVAAAA
ncbi:MAG TPA: protein kinase [Thermoanaerobaculia bacterium]|nr:protein kinase [Thermoanaerobaculia bacterium]